MARKYACSYEEYYDSNAIWIDAETQSSIKKTFERLVIEEINRKLSESRKTFIKEKESEKDREITSVVKDVYRYFKDANSLFIFDNVQEYKDISDLLPSSLSTKYKNLTF